MYTRNVFPAWEMIKWTRYESLKFVLIGTIAVILIEYLGLTWIKLPWAPIAVIGSAVAFVIGFQNNSAYGRIWEARMIWGGIVNTSRTFGMFVQDMLTNQHALKKLSEAELQHEIKTLTYRHIAWLTALRHAMRQPKPWEIGLSDRGNKKWADNVPIPEKQSTLLKDLTPYLSQEDLSYALAKNNKQTALLYLQSHHLRKLKENGVVWEFAFLELENLVQEMFTLQGKSERIKNFPYPRQFATLNHYFMWIFVLLLPLGVVPQFAEIGQEIISSFPVIGKLFVWFSIPVYALLAWVFHTMERIGRTGENPFEGLGNDVPISTIARGIEIDLRQNLGENDEDIPDQFPEHWNTQM